MVTYDNQATGQSIVLTTKKIYRHRFLIAICKVSKVQQRPKHMDSILIDFVDRNLCRKIDWLTFWKEEQVLVGKKLVENHSIKRSCVIGTISICLRAYPHIFGKIEFGKKISHIHFLKKLARSPHSLLWLLLEFDCRLNWYLEIAFLEQGKVQKWVNPLLFC